MHVWVTRAQPGADETAERLRALGHDPLVAPVLAVQALDAEIDLAGIAALAFTSRNGVAAFAQASPERALPAFTVGDATAEAAREAGFTSVRSAGGDVHALAALLAEHAAELDGPVLHAGAREPAGDLPGLLAGKLEVRAVPLYATVPAAPEAALPRLDSLQAVLVHSPKAARRLADLLSPARDGDLRFLCISAAAAAPLGARGFKKLSLARFPDEDHLLKLLDEQPNEDLMSPSVAEPADPIDLPEPAPRRPSKAIWFFVPYTLLLIAAAVAVVMNAERLGLKRHRAPTPAATVAAAPAGEAQLRARIAELETQLAAARAAPAAPSALNDATAQALSERLNRLEAGQTRTVRAAAAAVAAAALADAAEESRPFAAELAALERLAPNEPALAELRPLARTGAPSRAALAAEFPTVAARAASASRAAPGDSFLNRAMDALSSIITIRRVDDLTGSEADAVLARAEKRVAAGDLEGALTELQGLPSGGRKAMAGWTEQARRRVELEDRIADLRTDALRDLAQTAWGAPGSNAGGAAG